MSGEGRHQGLIALGILCLVAALLLQIQVPSTDQEPAKVRLWIIDPDGTERYNSTLRLDADEANVLGALNKAKTLGDFPVDTTVYPGSGIFVTRIYEFPNRGACGWVYYVNDVDGAIAADRQPLHEGDRVAWTWRCDA